MAKQVTLRLLEPTATVASLAATIAAEYASNRGKTNAGRLAASLAAAITAATARGGDAVEVTEHYPYEGGTSPMYNILHRAIGTTPFRETPVRGRKGRTLWSCIKPVALTITAQYVGDDGHTYVVGDSSTLAAGDDVRLFIISAV